MITPKEIETKEFTSNKSGGFYKADEVDQFLDEILLDYSSLLQERNVLKNKVSLLTEQLAASAKPAVPAPAPVPTPQAAPASDANLTDARKEARRLVADAEDYAKKLIETAQQEANRQNAVSQKLTGEIETFRKNLLAAYEEHIKLINDIPGMNFEDVKIGSETLDILNMSIGQKESSAEPEVRIEGIPEGDELFSAKPVAAPAENSSSDSVFFEEPEPVKVAYPPKPKAQAKPASGLEGLFGDDDEEPAKDKAKKKKKKKFFFRDEDEDDDFFDDDDE